MGVRACRNPIIGPFICLITLLPSLPARGSTPEATLHPTLVVAGEVTRRTEVWDRRTNSLMGRPDFMKAIEFEVRVTGVLAGRLPPDTRSITMVVTERVRLNEFRTLQEGWRGHLHLAGDHVPYTLVSVSDGVAPPPRPPVRPAPVQPPARKPVFPDDLNGRDLRDSMELQEKAVREIARRYGMADAAIVFLVSHQGPMPPRGGYVFWGVKGRIHGRWHIWQAGDRKPRLGEELTDPMQYQK